MKYTNNSRSWNWISSQRNLSCQNLSKALLASRRKALVCGVGKVRDHSNKLKASRVLTRNQKYSVQMSASISYRIWPRRRFQNTAESPEQLFPTLLEDDQCRNTPKAKETAYTPC